MIRTLGKWYLLFATLAAHVAVYGGMLTIPSLRDDGLEWLYITLPFADVGVLGFWLVTGRSRAWLRLLTGVVGFCVILAICSRSANIYPFSLGAALAATMSLTAICTLTLGCVAGYLPGWQGWRARFALWEVIVATGLIGVALAELRALVIENPFSWQEWLGEEGIQLLIFSVASGAFLAIAGLPVLSAGKKVIWISIAAMVALLAVMPYLEVALFRILNQGLPEIRFLLVVHLMQIGFAWSTLIPLRMTFPEFVAMTEPPSDPPTNAAETTASDSPSETDDFAELT